MDSELHTRLLGQLQERNRKEKEGIAKVITSSKNFRQVQTSISTINSSQFKVKLSENRTQVKVTHWSLTH